MFFSGKLYRHAELCDTEKQNTILLCPGTEEPMEMWRNRHKTVILMSTYFGQLGIILLSTIITKLLPSSTVENALTCYSKLLPTLPLETAPMALSLLSSVAGGDQRCWSSAACRCSGHHNKGSWPDIPLCHHPRTQNCSLIRKRTFQFR